LQKTFQSDDQFDLNKVILNSTKGKILLSYFAKEKRLSPKYRKLLSLIIIEHLVANNIQPKQNLLNEISEKIVLLFESEIKVIFVNM